VEFPVFEIRGLVELGFDVALAGFELPEVDLILSEADRSALSSFW
jgi:hypothetical protein